MIRSLLIANRGEIACRIIATCRRLGIRSIAVFSDADAGARHVRLADEAVRIGPAPARESYLDPERILAAARASGAEAIHPGYGFLSEKPVLPQMCEAAGLVFVGPSARCIEAMGSKIGAKEIAAAAGVPCVPGYAGADQSEARLTDEARAIGFPIMVKASAGGGGKGMRRVFMPDELPGALAVARSEAESAFGDGSLLLERLVRRPRHLEVQVAGDRFGGVVHMFERDCSVQRNHQKLIEEAPAPNLSPAIRDKLHERAVALCRAIGYDNLGTVEFILDEEGEEPWFLEMNTRLQVEHPVTEAITGLDLVEWQIRIASGERLPLAQEAITATGWAIEARITAERADLGFMPDAGTVLAYAEPAGLRMESGIGAGSEVTLHYDSLLAKAIAHGATREEARTRLLAGLADTAILGPATTLPFLGDVLAHPIFAEGRATTGLLDEAFPGGWKPARAGGALAEAVAAVIRVETPVSTGPPAPSPWSALRGFRVLGPAGARAVVRVLLGPQDTPAAVESLGDARYRVTRDGASIDLRLTRTGERIEVETEGRRLRGLAAAAGDIVAVSLPGDAVTLPVRFAVAATSAATGAGSGRGAVLAPMPGLVAEIKVAEGERVARGQVVAVLESMKLFMPLEAEIDGVVGEIACRAGETVGAGKLLLAISPDAPSPGET
jgi:3-methylcrotonyl-CoA carboxylase alpha subunit